MTSPETPSASDDARRQNPLRGRVARAGHTPASTGNLANIITVIRIFLAPVFIWMLFADNHEFGLLRYLAAALFIFAIATDSVDGLLARRQNLVTDVGKILDPIADKVLTGGALIALSMIGDLWWWVTIVILIRELGITVFRLVVVRKRVIPASRGGKLKTVAQAIAISFYLVPLWLIFGDWVHWFNGVLMAVVLVLTVSTGVEYLVNAFRHRGSAPREAQRAS